MSIQRSFLHANVPQTVFCKFLCLSTQLKSISKLASSTRNLPSPFDFPLNLLSMCTYHSLFLKLLSFYCLGPPIINRSTSKLSNTCLYLEWKITKASDFVDFFIVEISSVHRRHASRKTGKFKEVFRGLKTNLQLKNLPYSKTVVCRVFAVNSCGKSRPCDKFEGQTMRGNNNHCGAFEARKISFSFIHSLI